MDDEDVLDGYGGSQPGRADLLRVHPRAAAGPGRAAVGRRAAGHWSALHQLPYFGAEIADERVTVNGKMVFAVGVTAGIDGALQAVAELRRVIGQRKGELRGLTWELT